ncbi:MAG: 23S rRNA (pseudouridine(1915)-N(3))-methyltransferase RlmH [Rhodospirillaceae bacterium]|nr:23S rRNA (pseudouridine(1915)-N(3))-methyltransferase RlmH [Rhodospirillaceae bacterium]MCY4065666.1 23S rRNA (pseudouridine(1915)-N(3))-methyltransferase RlmH [Rhodospirillaceae bacterium]
MRICVIAVGRLRDGAPKDLFATYSKRLPWPLAVIEIAERGNDPPSVRVQREGEALRRRLPDGPLVVLDRSGTNLTSEALAAALARYRDNGAATVAFAIGGADGHAPETLAAADLVLSFGKATWPHQLVRVMLAEQLYRASTILAGHPYHRG